MRIKEFSIFQYGPLRNRESIALSDFNLFFGNNEEGKTLTIDALVKLLLGKNLRVFEKINRIEEKPEGYIYIEDNTGKKIKLPEKGDLTLLINLSPSECRNIFIIRNSDLSITNEANFYTNITDRLTGLRTEEIEGIKKELREIGKLAPTGIFRDDSKSNKLKSRIEGIKQLIDSIEDLPEEIDIDELDKIDEKSVKCVEEIKEKIFDIENLEDSRNREKYEKGIEALKKLKDSLEKLKKLNKYNDDDALLWRDSEKEIENCTKEKQKLLLKQKENEEELKKITGKLKEKERDFQILNDRKNILDNDVKPELRNYEKGKIEIAKLEKKGKLFSFLRISSIVIIILSLLGAIINPLLLFIILTILFSVLFLIFLFPFIQISVKNSRLNVILEKIRLTLLKYDLSAEKFKDIISNIQKIDEEFQKRSVEIQDIKREEDILKHKITNIKDEQVPGKDQKISGAQDEINRIKRKSGENSIKDYNDKLKIKNNVKDVVLKQHSILGSIIGESEGTVEEKIIFWDKEIRELEEFKDKALGIGYNEKKVTRLKDEKSQLEDELERINDQKEIYQKQLEEIEREANSLLLLESDLLHCRTSVDLKVTKLKLQDFLDENENLRENILKSVNIFEEIEAEEKEKVSELFGEESSISKYFYEITDGFYETVFFNQETSKIEAIRKDGEILEAEKLSGGALDQLYLSIRLALGEKLLKGDKGFFILDDPFIKSDEIRLKRQLEMLLNISKTGWQILYFSAKGEVNEYLQKYIDDSAVNFIEVAS